MPGLPVIADTFQAVLNWATPGGQTAKNVMYFGLIDTGDSAGLAAALDASVTDDMLHAVASAATAASVSVRPLDGVTAPTPYPLTNWQGTEPGDFIPNVAQCLSLYTAVAGRNNRGRLYLPFCPEDAAENGQLIGDAATVVEPAWNTFLTTMGDAGYEMVVASLITQHTHTVHNSDHSVTRGVPTGSATPHTNPVTRITARNVLATQRRRQSRLRSS